MEKVDGIQVKNFKHLNQLLDRPAPGGTHRIEVSQQPYTMYMSQQEAAKAGPLHPDAGRSRTPQGLSLPSRYAAVLQHTF